MKLTKKVKKEFRNCLSYHSVKEFYKLIERLGSDIIIVKMKCALNSYDVGSYIKAEIARPYINLKDNCVEDYAHGKVFLIWDKSGKLVKSEISIPEKTN